MVDPHWPSNVLEALLAQILECKVELTCCVLLDTGRNANATRFGQTFETGRDVHPVTENVAVLNNDVADIDAYSKFNSFLGGDLGIILGHGALDFRSRTAEHLRHW